MESGHIKHYVCHIHINFSQNLQEYIIHINLTSGHIKHYVCQCTNYLCTHKAPPLCTHNPHLLYFVRIRPFTSFINTRVFFSHKPYQPINKSSFSKPLIDG